VADEIADYDGPAAHVGQRPVAAVGDRPHRSPDGRCRIPSLGAELAVFVAAVQQLRVFLESAATVALPLCVLRTSAPRGKLVPFDERQRR
jgi:hypothetical protein